MPSLRIELFGQAVTARLEGRFVRIGRDPECDLTIDDPSVAAVHATIEPLPDGGHKLTDANSGRPTLVNGLVAKRVALKPGDVVQIGPARITYTAGGAGSAAPRPRPAAAPASVPAAAPVASVAPPAPRRPEGVPAVAVVPTPAVARSTAAPDERVAPTSSGTSRTAPRRRMGRTLLVVGVVGAAAIGLSFALRHGGDDPSLALRAWKDRLDAANAIAATNVDAALGRLDDLARPSTPVDGVRRDAKAAADALRARLASAARDFQRLEQEAAEVDPARTEAAWRALRESYGPAIAKRYDAARTRGAASFEERVAARGRDATAKAAALIAEAKFGAATAVYDELEADLPWTDSARRLLEEGRATLAETAGAAWTAAAGEAAGIAREQGPAAAAMHLRSILPRFAGTPLARAVADRATQYDREVVSVAVVPTPRTPTSPPATGPVPSPGTTSVPPPGASAPTPTPAAPSVPTPAPAAPSALADATRLEGLLADAQTKLASRRISDAIPLLEEAAKVAAGTTSAARVAGALEDATTAQEGLRLLGAAIREHPNRFAGFPMSSSFAPNLVGADERFVDAAVSGGTTRLPWTSFDGARLARLVERAKATGPAALVVATLLHVVGADEAAERALATARETGDAAAADARLARWRGEAVPAGGYVVHAGRLVSPAERERILLTARISAAVAGVGAKDAGKRKAACEELLSIGAPAKEAFVKALTLRRAAAVAEVAGNRSLSSGSVRQKLQAELEKRRAAAIAWIEDPVRYPYPYTEAHEGQKEVDALVDAVREVWHRPFDLVSTWDKGAAEALALVTEVDDVLARVEEGYAGSLDEVKAAINKAIDVPGISPDDVSKKLLAYNEKVKTTATPQEKDNVRAVNEYRIMMGRTAVKIDERLQRGARGHSAEMRRLGYFAHESPTPGRESPGKRCALEGYGGGVGENIAMGVTSGRDAFDGWFHSSGHHRNMLNKGWTEMGCGRSGPAHWTQCFGGMTGHGTKEPDPLPPPRPDVAPDPEGEDGMPADGGAPGAPGSGG